MKPCVQNLLCCSPCWREDCWSGTCTPSFWVFPMKPVKAQFSSFTLFFVAMFSALWYLRTRDLRFDAAAAAINEVAFAFATITLITGMIWGRIIWGIWWAWDPRITSYFICLLMYFGYFMMRRAVDEPHRRARLSAVLSILASVDIVIVWKSIEWFRTQHPGPVLEIRGGGGMAPGMEAPLFWNVLVFLMLETALVLVRKSNRCAGTRTRFRSLSWIETSSTCSGASRQRG